MDDDSSTDDLGSCCRYSTSKAGMEGLDKATIMEIILENSKGSKFYENELRKEKSLRQQIEQKLKIVKSLTPTMLKSGEAEADIILKNLKERRRLSRCIVHVDMDAFYAAVEIRDQPELRHHPVAVGSNSMLSTSNYIARRYGVRAGLPGFLGKKLCPQLKIIPCDFAKYIATSRVVRGILMEYASTEKNTTTEDSCESDVIPFSAVSLDEAYLDLTDHLTERCEFPVERRTFWPRSAPGAPMLVCRCQSRSKNTDSKTLNNTSAYVQLKPSTGDDDNSQSNSNTCQEVKTLDESSLSNSKTKYCDPELAVCDECGLLCKSGRRVFGVSAWEAVREMRFRVFCATRLTCSAGIGPNTLIAKIASDWIKPCGQYEIANTLEAVDAFMQSMPVRKVPGIGHVTERRLDAFGVKTCSDLIDKRGLLWHVSTRITMAYYMRIALGHSDDQWLLNFKNNSDEKLAKSSGIVEGSTGTQSQIELNRKSMSVERTFSDTCDESELIQRCEQLAQMLSSDLKEEHVKGQHITLKMKLDTFEVRTKSQLLPDYTNHSEIINSFGRELLREEMIAHKSNPSNNNKPLTLRLMGLRLSNLLPAEMCPQIRQRSVEEAFMHAIPTNNACTISPINSLKNKATNQVNKSSSKLKKSTKSKSKQLNKSNKRTEKRRDRKPSLNSASSSPLLTQWTKTPLSMKINQPSTLNACVVSLNSFPETCLPSTSTTAIPSSSSSMSLSSGAVYTCFPCPVCEKNFQFSSEEKFNYHLDECLNRSAILEAVKETFTGQSACDECSSSTTVLQQLSSTRLPGGKGSLSTDGVSTRQPKLQKVKPSGPGSSSSGGSMHHHGPLDKFIENSSSSVHNMIKQQNFDSTMY
uniref:DNA polymerase kappa n=1 Tax=Trichobilharzia regenti TaxID=157069 RepID=A0AA85JZU0_TRIRE|nr:unnamed protein product [Trichobilharzia regenti]